MADKPVKLDLGSGPKPARGFRGIDLYCGKTKADRVDLFQTPWPWEDSSVDFVRCSHFIEHLPAPYMRPEPLPADWRTSMQLDEVYDRPWTMRYPLVEFMTELYRVLKPGGQAHIIHPHLKSERAFQDPTHCVFLPMSAWLYVQRPWRIENQLDHPPYPLVDFQVQASYDNIPATVTMRPEAGQQQWINHFWEAAGDVQVLLTSLKEDPAPPVQKARTPRKR